MWRVGYSRLRDFVRCPLFHHWKHVEKIPEPILRPRAERMERGSLVQRTVEQFYRQELWRGNPLDGLYQALQSAAATMPPGYAGLTVEITGLVPGMLQTMRDERLVGPRADVERPVSLVVEGVSIEGRADLVVLGTDQRTTLIDGKMGTADPAQLQIYAMGLSETPWGFPHRVGTWFYRKGTVQWLTIRPALLSRFRVKLAGRMQGWKAGDRTPRVGSHCRMCGYNPQCEAYIQFARARQSSVAVPNGGGFVSL